MDEQRIRVSKLDAARRQLRTAIELWFTEADPVSVHALAYASHEVIYDLNKKKGTQAKHFLGAQYLPPELLEAAMPYIRKAGSFFKHADRNGEDFLDFETKSNKWMIISAIAGLQTLGETLNGHELAFYWWMVLRDPDALPGEFEKLQQRLPASVLANFRRLSRKQYFEQILDVLPLFRGGA